MRGIKFLSIFLEGTVADRRVLVGRLCTGSRADSELEAPPVRPHLPDQRERSA